MKWQDKLSGLQVKHLREQRIRSLKAFKRTREAQKGMMENARSKHEPCWECRKIALALGLEEIEEKQEMIEFTPKVFGTWVFRYAKGAARLDLKTAKGVPAPGMTFITMRPTNATPDTALEFAWASRQGRKGDCVMVCNGDKIVLLEEIA